MNNASTYTLNVWLTALLLTPLLILVGGSIFGLISIISLGSLEVLSNSGVFFLILILIITFSGILSIPSACILWLTVYLILTYADINILGTKLILSVIGICLSALPFLIVPDMLSMMPDILLVCLPYAVTIVACIWYYKLPEYKEAPSGTRQQSSPKR